MLAGGLFTTKEQTLGRESGKFFLEEANKYIFVRRYDKAWRILCKMLGEKEFADDLLLHLRRIELAAKIGKVDELHKIYKESIHRHPDSPVPALALAMLEQHNEIITPSDAIEIFQQIMQQTGPHPAAYYGIGFSMELMGNLERARINYEQCLNIGPSWHPAYFGLSQVFYQLKDEKAGDRYFFLFEEIAPFNVYGNFATHRKLSAEFLEREMYREAQTAITTLAEWWVGNRGVSPPEVLIYEAFFVAKVLAAEGRAKDADEQIGKGRLLAEQLMSDETSAANILFFAAKTVEEFGQIQLAVAFYQKILQREASNPALVQQIGNQFLSTGEFQLAVDVFTEAYKYHPDSPDIRFCLLVAKLKIAKVNVEEYLILKERLRQTSKQGAEKMEILSILHGLTEIWAADPEVHAIAGDLYQSLGNIDRARHHYESMLRFDPESKVSRLKYSGFEMHYGNLERGKEVLDAIDSGSDLSRSQVAEVHWLRAAYHYRNEEHDKARRQLATVIKLDPWNISYLVLDLMSHATLLHIEEAMGEKDPVLHKLENSNDADLDWEKFDACTDKIEAMHHYEMAYNRQKLRFLYTMGDISMLMRLTAIGSRYNPERAMYDFLRLLNTNFDSIQVYWALGTFAAESWQLETACHWYEQALLYPGIAPLAKAQVYLDMADCYIWRNQQLPKAIEYAKLALELGLKEIPKAYRILAHAYLRLGQIREAQKFLIDTTGVDDPEMAYLRGLVHYRNGALHKAKDLWKPLLTLAAPNLRFHPIKQEIMKYYFDQAPYLEVN